MLDSAKNGKTFAEKQGISVFGVNFVENQTAEQHDD
jgi:hypothetical protein